MREHLFKRSIFFFILGTLALIGLQTLQANADDEERIPASRVRQGYRIAPVPLNLQGKNRTWVGLGSYLVNAGGGCNDCHTWPNYKEGGDPFQGQPEQINTDHYLAGGRPFGPFIKSANITPDGSGKPAGLTREEFIHLMRTGQDPDEPGELLQVMPWPVYGKMTEQDLKAIYEYLSAIPHAEPAPPAP